MHATNICSLDMHMESEIACSTWPLCWQMDGALITQNGPALSESLRGIRTLGLRGAISIIRILTKYYHKEFQR